MTKRICKLAGYYRRVLNEYFLPNYEFSDTRLNEFFQPVYLQKDIETNEFQILLGFDYTTPAKYHLVIYGGEGYINDFFLEKWKLEFDGNTNVVDPTSDEKLNTTLVELLTKQYTSTKSRMERNVTYGAFSPKHSLYSTTSSVRVTDKPKNS